MKRLLGLFLVLLGVTPPSLQGLLLSTILTLDSPAAAPPPAAHPASAPVPPAPTYPIEVSYTKIDKIKDQIATTTVDQEFYNPNARQLEGTFLFPAQRCAPQQIHHGNQRQTG